MDRIERERLLFLYSSALDRGDLETLSDVLAKAETDALLGELILDLNVAYMQSAPINELNDSSVDSPVTLLPVNEPGASQTNRKSRWSAGLLISAAALFTSLIFLLMLLGMPEIREAQPTGAISGRPVLTRNNVNRIAPVVRIGSGAVYDFAWSPDGQTLAVASATGLHYFSGETLQPQAMPSELQMPLRVQAVDFSADGSQIALLTRHGIEVAHAVTGESVASTSGSFAEFVHLAVDGRLITGQCRADALTCATFDVILLAGEKSQVITRDSNMKPILSADGKLLATSDGRQIRVWDTTGEFDTPLVNLRSPRSGPLQAMEFDAGDTQITARVDIGEVENPHSNAGTTVLADELITWDVNSGDIVQKATVLEPSDITFVHKPGMDYHAYQLQTGDNGSATTLQPLVLSANSETFARDGLPLRDVRYSPDDQQIALLLTDGRLAVWSLMDVMQPRLRGTLDTFFSSVDQIEFSPASSLLAFANALRVDVYDFALSDRLHAALLQPMRPLSQPSGDRGLSFAPDGTLAYADAETGRSGIAFWNPDDGVTIESIGTRTLSDATAIHYDSFGALLAYFADSETLVRRFPEQEEFSIESVTLSFATYASTSSQSAFSADGHWLAVAGCQSRQTPGFVACDDYEVALFDTMTGDVIATLSTGFLGPGDGLALGTSSADGRALLALSGCVNYGEVVALDATCAQGAIAVWDVTSILSGASTQPVALSLIDSSGSVALNADATLLAVANDSQLQVIDIATGDILFTQSRNSSDRGVAFNQENTLLAVGNDGTVLLYGLSLD